MGNSPRLLPLMVLLLAGTGWSQTILDEQRVNTNGFNPSSANAIDGINLEYDANAGMFYMAWADQFATTNATQDIYFASSADEGVTWSTPVRVDLGDAANATDSDLAKTALADDGTILVAWEDKRDANANGSNNEDVFYNRSTDGGVTWMPTSLALNSGTAGAHVTSDIDRIQIIAEGNTFHATWEEDSNTAIGGNEECWYTRSTDSGATWSAPVIVAPALPGPNQADVDDPKVEAEGSTVIIVWIDNSNTNDQIFAIRSTDSGATFGAAVNVESDPTGNADEAHLNFEGSNVLVSWTDTSAASLANDTPHAAVSTDGGATWGMETPLAPILDTVAADGDGPSAHIDPTSPNNLYVTWASDHPGILLGGNGGSDENEVFLAVSNDSGATWNTEFQNQPGFNANRPVIMSDGPVYLWYEPNPDGSNVGAFDWSEDNGVTWSIAGMVPSTGPDVDGNNLDEGNSWAVSPNSDTFIVGHFDNGLGQNEVYASGFTLSGGIGTVYCSPAVANSTGNPATISADGSDVVGDNDVTLMAADLPPNEFGYFLNSMTQANTFPVPNSQGTLCLGGAIGRYNIQAFNSGAGGMGQLVLDLANTPTPTGLVSIQAGETWNFTCWYRDMNPGTTSNFTPGLEILFQ